MFRYSLLFRDYTDGSTTKDVTIIQNAVLWGPSVYRKLIVVIAPVAVMIMTIFIIMVSFYQVRVGGKMDLKDIMPFNPTATPHIVVLGRHGTSKLPASPLIKKWIHVTSSMGSWGRSSGGEFQG